MEPRPSIAIVGAPLDLGASRRGVDMGPSALRYAGLAERLESLGLKVEDCGNVATDMPETASERDQKARYLPTILKSCAQLAVRVGDITRKGESWSAARGETSAARPPATAGGASRRGRRRSL